MIIRFSKYDYHYENLLANSTPKTSFIYSYSTANKQKLRLGVDENGMPRVKETDYDYKITSTANIPLSPHEILDLMIKVKVKGEIEKYSINYRNYQPPKFSDGVKTGLLPGYSYEDMSSILVRTDHAHGKVHLNINYFQETSPGRYNKINDPSIDFVEQDIRIDGYDHGGLEQIMNLVLWQAEKLSPMAGIRYWLLSSYTNINEGQIQHKWLNSGIQTPLCILANNIRNKLFDQTFHLSQIDHAKIMEITDNRLEMIRKYELSNPDQSPIEQSIRDKEYRLPFPMVIFPDFHSDNMLIELPK